MTYVIMKTDTIEELYHGYKRRVQLRMIVMSYGIWLLVTGLATGLVNPYLF